MHGFSDMLKPISPSLGGRLRGCDQVIRSPGKNMCKSGLLYNLNLKAHFYLLPILGHPSIKINSDNKQLNFLDFFINQNNY